MRAIAFKQPGPIDREDSLVDIELPDPVATGRDLLVRVHAASVNPVDVKVRAGMRGGSEEWRVLGYDAAGEVVAVGPEVTGFKVGDVVMYAGQIDRPGSNAELQLVDERIVGPKPQSLDWAAAAALPLTTITAWEALFDKLEVKRAIPGAAPAVLIVNGAGGVGSITIQLLRALTDLTVIATASRDETKAWVKELGAHHVISHREPMAPQIEALGIGKPGHVFSTSHTDDHLADILQLIAPQGKLCLIDDPKTLDVMPLKTKAISLHWELMFTRSLFKTADMGEQGRLLAEVAQLIDAGQVRSTLTETLGMINADNLKKAHALIESGKARGKVVLAGW
ncbi:zinc-binding alcohol dehydrogenase family protein [Sphingomonas radiodurans]|uniref:zinc-binding alcohol dehydrogenase family protein n=1 Tax=Sphingomonas radiodurans TaxID=2890321 RepID=UPI001E5F537A|nr:zinc-binding alcohol dehydrogenase family protein [Sphingomonas radiodurans]WBH16515.1 zinc-binding alcohol dehydrogenase family protein [Sphingomonas radiodurans]